VAIDFSRHCLLTPSQHAIIQSLVQSTNYQRHEQGIAIMEVCNLDYILQPGDQLLMKRRLTTLGKSALGFMVGSPIVIGSAFIASLGLVIGTAAATAIYHKVNGAYKNMTEAQKGALEKLMKGNWTYEHHAIYKDPETLIMVDGEVIDFLLGWVGYCPAGKECRTTIKKAPLHKTLEGDWMFHRSPMEIRRYAEGVAMSPAQTLDFIEDSGVEGEEIHWPLGSTNPDDYGYDLFKRNCEHFATWARTGEWASCQVDKLAAEGEFPQSAETLSPAEERKLCASDVLANIPLKAER